MFEKIDPSLQREMLEFYLRFPEGPESFGTVSKVRVLAVLLDDMKRRFKRRFEGGDEAPFENDSSTALLTTPTHRQLRMSREEFQALIVRSSNQFDEAFEALSPLSRLAVHIAHQRVFTNLNKWRYERVLQAVAERVADDPLVRKLPARTKRNGKSWDWAVCLMVLDSMEVSDSPLLGNDKEPAGARQLLDATENSFWSALEKLAAPARDRGGTLSR